MTGFEVPILCDSCAYPTFYTLFRSFHQFTLPNSRGTRIQACTKKEKKNITTTTYEDWLHTHGLERGRDRRSSSNGLARWLKIGRRLLHRGNHVTSLRNGEIYTHTHTRCGSAETRKWRCNRPNIIVPQREVGRTRLVHAYRHRVTTFLLASYFLLLRTSTFPLPPLPPSLPRSQPGEEGEGGIDQVFTDVCADSWRDSINNACNNTRQRSASFCYYRARYTAHRRSAVIIITTLLRKMKVSRCCFTPTRETGGGWISSRKDRETIRSDQTRARPGIARGREFGKLV